MNEQKNTQTFFDKAQPPFYIEEKSFSFPETEQRYHYHDCFEICFVTEGELYFFIKDRSYNLKKGSIIIANSYDIHSTLSKSNMPYSRFLLKFRRDFFDTALTNEEKQELFSPFSEEFKLIKLTKKEENDILSLFSEMKKEYEGGDRSSAVCLRALLARLLVFLTRSKSRLTHSENVEMKASHKIISDACAYINKNFSSELTLDSVSDFFHVSPSHFSRTFKKVTGHLFTDYLNSVRIKEAKRLLKKTDKSIIEIGQDVGYKSNTHFGRVFKSLLGVSPLSYRKLHK
jgi:AraC-like DNA-binding protein/quercetin dioxygenase-like cupin family protein